MTSSNGSIFRVTGPMWGESAGDRWIPLTEASDSELWCFLWYTPEQGWANTGDTGHLRRHRLHYDVTVKIFLSAFYGVIHTSLIVRPSLWNNRRTTIDGFSFIQKCMSKGSKLQNPVTLFLCILQVGAVVMCIFAIILLVLNNEESRKTEADRKVQGFKVKLISFSVQLKFTLNMNTFLWCAICCGCIITCYWIYSFAHIPRDCCTGTLPQYEWNTPEEYNRIGRH